MQKFFLVDCIPVKVCRRGVEGFLILIFFAVWPYTGYWTEDPTSPTLLLFCWGIGISIIWFILDAFSSFQFFNSFCAFPSSISLKLPGMPKMQSEVVMAIILMDVD